MDEEMDDFGDLYADLDTHVNAAPLSAPPLKSLSISAEIKSETDPIPEELAPDGGRPTPASAVEDDSSSDSDDDLRIVLNEGNRSGIPRSQRPSLGSDEDDEGDDLVIVADRPSKGQTWAERMPSPDDGLVHGDAERGGSAKHHGWYVGSNSGIYPRNAKPLMSGRGEWDQPQIPWPGGSVHRNIGIPTGEQNGPGFSLPRNRTIFDMSIEAFEKKPWRLHGVDITDFFNFGLDEECWKIYCENLRCYRQQAGISKGFPNYEPSRLNQSWQGEVSSSVLENAAKGRRFEMPKGRAIQVEGGEGERMPSIDIRRPRYRDSDVVIRITMEDSMNDASLPRKKELEHLEGQGCADGFIQKSQNTANDGLLHLDHGSVGYGQKTEPVKCYSSEENEIVPKGTAGEAKAEMECKKGDRMISSRVDGSIFESGSTSGDHILHVASSSDTEGHSEASHGISLEGFGNPAKNISFSSGVQLKESKKSDNHLLNNSRCDISNADEEDEEDNIHNYSCPPRNHRNRRSSFQVVGEPNAWLDDEHTFSQAYREWQNDADLIEARSGARDRKCDYSFDGGCSPSDREHEVSRYYRSRSYSEKQDSGNSYAKFSHKSDHQDNYPSRNWDESESLFKQRVGSVNNEIKQSEHYFHAEDHDDQESRDVTHKHSDRSISEHHFPLREKDLHFWQRNKRAACRNMMEAVYNKRLNEDRSREGFVQEMHERCTTYRSREEEVLNHKLARLVPHKSRELRHLTQRHVYEEDSCFDLDRPSRYAENDTKNSKNLSRRLLVSHSCKQTHIIAYERGCRDTSPSKTDLLVSRETSKRYLYHREHSNIEEIPSKNKKDGCFIRANKDPCHPYNRSCLDYRDDHDIAEDRFAYNDGIASSEKRRCNWLAETEFCKDDQVNKRHQKGCNLFIPRVYSSLEKSPRHEKSLVNNDSLGGQTFFDDHHDRKAIAAEECVNFFVRDHTSSVSGIFENGMHELASVGCKEAVNVHLNGYKGKFPGRCNKVKRGSNRNRDREDKIGKLMKVTRSIEEPYKRKEISSHTLKVEEKHASPGKLNIPASREGNSEHSVDQIVKNCYDTPPNAGNHEDEELEEGELIEGPDSQEVTTVKKKVNVEKKVACRVIESSGSNSVGNSIRSEVFARNSKILGGYDNNHILEALAKMEKRRERFKESIAPQEDPKKGLNQQIGNAVVMDEVKQLRPARKRCWKGT